MGAKEGRAARLEKARAFVLANARLLDRRRYEMQFEGGSADGVISALKAYQNPDGGFGNALEPDMRTSASQPVAVEQALWIMDEANRFDAEIIAGIASYLKSITVPATGGFPRALLTVNDAPHAPWWITEDDQQPSLNPTGNILGLLYKQTAVNDFKQEEWFTRSAEFIWNRIPQADQTDYHDLHQCITFLQYAPDRGRASAMQEELNEWLRQPGVIELDPRAEGYVHKVLDWAPVPTSYAAELISTADIERHLDDLEEQQEADGGWKVSFPSISPGNGAEWRGHITVNRLITLRAYGRL
ncbi:hypothetical protein [Paenibacillus sp. S28]|uniref:hypothetical protein n=1 Tax=Paenibacillus sp. S28 TaxID=2767463 RepID=UPI00190E5ADD|nr:hypothetical protein [Paenibacillus sp. S28]MBJ9992700.1 hypothetical protein [Paenibacillus sp. S28]